MAKVYEKYKDSGIAWIGEIPSEWNVLPIKHALSWKSDKGHGDAQVLSLYRDLGIVPKDSRDDNHNVTSEKTDEYKYVNAGDFVVNKMKAWQGSMALSSYNGIVSPAYYVFTFTNDQVYKPYFHYLLRNDSYLPEYRRLSTGLRIGQWDLGFEDFKEIPFLLPSFEEQRNIADFLDKKCSEIDSLISLQQEMISELQDYKQSIISEVVCTGLDRNRNLKNSNVEWIGTIPESWEVKPLKNCFSFAKGLPITKDDLLETGIPVISYGQIHGKFNTGTTTHSDLIRYVAEDFINSNPQSLTKNGDFIFADTSEDKEGCGNCAFIDRDESIFAGYHTIIAHPIDDKISKYHAYLFRTDCWRSQIRSRVAGIKLFSITLKILSYNSVIIPPKDEQLRIVEYLDKKTSQLDILISIKQDKIQELKDYKKSVVFEYVTGKKRV